MSYLEKLVNNKVEENEITRKKNAEAAKIAKENEWEEFQPWLKTNIPKYRKEVKNIFNKKIKDKDYYYLHLIDFKFSEASVAVIKKIGEAIEKDGFNVSYDYCHDGYESYDWEGSSNGWVYGDKKLFVSIPFDLTEKLRHG